VDAVRHSPVRGPGSPGPGGLEVGHEPDLDSGRVGPPGPRVHGRVGRRGPRSRRAVPTDKFFDASRGSPWLRATPDPT